jgi:hypothetical protein
MNRWLGEPVEPAPDASPVDHSEAIRLYAALKLAGRSEARLRERIAAGGGLPAADAPTRRILERLCAGGFDCAELTPSRKPFLRFIAFQRGTPATPAAAPDPFSGPLEWTAAAVLALPPSEARSRGAGWLEEHGATPDPAAASLVREALGQPSANPARYLLAAQQPADGNWHSPADRTGLLPTLLALRALRAAGYPADEAAPLRAAEWLRSVQNAGGGWGEAASSLDSTAWAVLGLLAGADTTSESVRQGVDFLLAAGPSGSPWPTLALAEWLRSFGEDG